MSPARMRLIAVASAVLMVLVVPPTEVSAAREQCGGNELCVWEHHDYGGCFARLPEKDKDYTDGRPTWTHCGPPGTHGPWGHINDQISSYWNRDHDQWAVFFAQTKWNGLALCAKPGASSPNLDNFSTFGDSPDDKFSSHVLWDRGEEPQSPDFLDAYGGGRCNEKDLD